MKTTIYLLLLLTTIALACNKQQILQQKPGGKPLSAGITSGSSGFKVIAYLPKYTSTLADHIDAFDFSKITHLNIAFFNPDVNGDFPASQGTGLDTIVSKAHMNDVKVLLSLGGGSNQSQYADLLTTANRADFVDNIVDLVSLYGVDGIDVDLEGDNIDSNYEAFILDLSAELKPQGKLLTAAVAWWTRSRITDSCLAAFDFINVMAYDKAGDEHSPYSYATQHLDYWKNDRGMPADKVVIGVPFYGYYTVSGSLYSMKFSQIVAAYPGSEYQDSVRRTDGYFVNYNGITTIQNKTALAQNGGGGIMFWQVLQDASGSLSLLKAIDDKINIDSGWTSPYVNWRYNLYTGGSSTFGDSTAIKYSVSYKGNPGFLPAPYYGYGKVHLPANCGGSFELSSATGIPRLKMTSSATSNPSKYSWYNIDESEAIAALSFELELDAAYTNGQLIIPFGYSTTGSTVFNNTNQLTSTYTPGVFGAIRLDFYGGSYATLSYRNSSYGYNVINNTTFNKTGNYKVELYCNNNSISTTYNKGGSTYTLPAQTFNVWVNGTRLATGASLVDFPASGELSSLSDINSLCVNGSGNSGTASPYTPPNSMQVYLSNVNVKYSLGD
ncbi:hypothetical protein COR50_19970 [Chitinophaga caeni]|uniref:chitinase n=1 Tax=Chitinophaga caeni TaxID=2029983 RepID=A0A291QZ96_9BACT|nr:glycosyl hydrolase family 18 protein [Chitinophaga caeni]ATL49267.1 hypothetical protein COR50_19970 [Chitinophaga caeni]